MDGEGSLPLPASNPFLLPFSREDLRSCILVLDTIAERLEMLSDEKYDLHALRKALDPIVKHRMDWYAKEISSKKKLSRSAMKQKDRELKDQTQLRATRREYLASLPKVIRDVNVLHGAVHHISTKAPPEEKETKPNRLHLTQTCYVCQKRHKDLHFFYDRLCIDCGTFNYNKRTIKADMTGKICLVTGARVKIGFQIALRLLRCGATVIGTTRFPYDGAKRFSLEEDFEIWKGRVHLFALDFRFIVSIENLCTYISKIWGKLDVIINNACQTIKRLPGFYQHVIENEPRYNDPSAMNSCLLPLLSRNMDFVNSFSRQQTIQSEEKLALSKAIADSTDGHEYYPTGAFTIHGQPVDLRDTNSWVMKLDEVSSVEFAEVFLINAIAPALINSRLKSLMMKDLNAMKFIVNVSAMEGKFYRFKTTNHPHLNMAKAALNMMTRTSASDYKKANIFMTCVDTGWISDDRPFPQAKAMMDLQDFQPPLDEIDGAARVLDPIFTPLNANPNPEPNYGIFLKNYKPTEW